MSIDNNKKNTAAQQSGEEINNEAEVEIKTEEIHSDDCAAKVEGNKKADKKSGAKGKKEEKSEEKVDETSDTTAEKAVDPALAAMNDKYLRLCAEYDNFRRRSQKEKDNLYGEVKADTLLKFLPVYDNLVRALATPTADEAYKKGVEMIMNQFNTTMEKLGVTKIESLGEKFDPTFHNAVMHIDDEEKGENEIVEVFQEGFAIGDKVIRFAMVKVAN